MQDIFYKSALQNFFEKGLDNCISLCYNPYISCEEDKQSVANVHREPAVGASR